MDQVERLPIKEWVGKTASAGRWSEGSEGSEAPVFRRTADMCPATQHNEVRNRVPISTITLASTNRVPALVMLGRNRRHLHRECFGLRPIDGLGARQDFLTQLCGIYSIFMYGQDHIGAR